MNQMIIPSSGADAAIAERGSGCKYGETRWAEALWRELPLHELRKECQERFVLERATCAEDQGVSVGGLGWAPGAFSLVVLRSGASEVRRRISARSL